MAAKPIIGYTGVPQATTTSLAINPNQRYDTGIPGFDILSQAASSNVADLLKGTESPAITQNMNAMWGVGAGVPGTDFLRGRAIDLYGQRSQARKEQGLADLLNMMQGYSGNVTARPGDILGAQTTQRGQDIAAQTAASQLGLGQDELAQRAREAEINAALQAAGLGIQGVNAGNNLLGTYLNFLK